MNKILPGDITKPMVIEYEGEYKLIFTEFNDYNANESLRIRKIRSTTENDELIYYITYDKERYDITDLVKKIQTVQKSEVDYLY